MAVSFSDGEFPDKGVVSPVDVADISRMSASVVESETCAA